MNNFQIKVWRWLGIIELGKAIKNLQLGIEAIQKTLESFDDSAETERLTEQLSQLRSDLDDVLAPRKDGKPKVEPETVAPGFMPLSKRKQRFEQAHAKTTAKPTGPKFELDVKKD